MLDLFLLLMVQMEESPYEREYNKPRVYITMGDPAGIGAEVAVRALSNKEIYTLCIPILLGSYAVLKDVLHFLPSNLSIKKIEGPEEALGQFGTIDLIDFDNIRLTDFTYGKPSQITGKAAVEYMEKAFRLICNDLGTQEVTSAIVSGPVSGSSLWMAGYSGKNDIEPFIEQSKVQFYFPIILHDHIRIAHVTDRIDVHQVTEGLSTERILTTISQTSLFLEQIGIPEPLIGVAGLNSYSGESGTPGKEEEQKILPALRLAKARGFHVEGPITPEMLVPYVESKRFDAGIAMQREQGFTAFRARMKYGRRSNRWNGVHGCCLYLGFPFLLTSVIHGPGYDRAGEGKASEESMIESILTAASLAKRQTSTLATLFRRKLGT